MYKATLHLNKHSLNYLTSPNQKTSLLLFRQTLIFGIRITYIYSFSLTLKDS
jgi:hypothetical protein